MKPNCNCACMEILRGVADSMRSEPKLKFHHAFEREMFYRDEHLDKRVEGQILKTINVSSPQAVSVPLIRGLLGLLLPARVTLPDDLIHAELDALEQRGLISIDRGGPLVTARRGRKEAA